MTIRVPRRASSSGLLPTAPEVNATPWRTVQLVPPERGPFTVRRATADQPLTSLIEALTPQANASRGVRPAFGMPLAPKPVALETLLPRLAVATPMTQLGATLAPTPQTPVVPTPPLRRPSLLGY